MLRPPAGAKLIGAAGRLLALLGGRESGERAETSVALARRPDGRQLLGLDELVVGPEALPPDDLALPNRDERPLTQLPLAQLDPT